MRDCLLAATQRGGRCDAVLGRRRRRRRRHEGARPFPPAGSRSAVQNSAQSRRQHRSPPGPPHESVPAPAAGSAARLVRFTRAFVSDCARAAAAPLLPAVLPTIAARPPPPRLALAAAAATMRHGVAIARCTATA